MNPSDPRQPVLAGIGDAATPGRVLVVDDEVPITRVVIRRLERDGVQCVVAHSGEEALARMEAAEFDAVITDISMPGISGLELMRRVKDRDPFVQVIIMTALMEVDTAIQAIRLQADDYLLKPFELDDLAASLRRRLEHRRIILENREYRRLLEERVRDQARRLQHMFIAGVRALVAALEAKDAHTRGHSDRVSRFAVSIAEVLGGVDVNSLALAAQLHDLGKIGTRDDVLGKPGPLTDLEFDHIREHPLIGTRILSPILDDPTVLGVVRHHHERWDGDGYPDHLAGDRIPLAARVVAVADTLDAITSTRAYRPSRSWDHALSEIAANTGTQFDPDVADAARIALPRPPAPAGAAGIRA